MKKQQQHWALAKKKKMGKWGEGEGNEAEKGVLFDLSSSAKKNKGVRRQKKKKLKFAKHRAKGRERMKEKRA